MAYSFCCYRHPQKQKCTQAFEDLSDLTPKQVVERLDRNIVGQTDAKKAVRSRFPCIWVVNVRLWHACP